MYAVYTKVLQYYNAHGQVMRRYVYKRVSSKVDTPEKAVDLMMAKQDRFKSKLVIREVADS